jgi:cobalt/nickel transport system permease protein
VSVVLGAALCSLELAASGTVPLAVAFPAMVGVHALIGVGEAILSVAAYNLLAGQRPDLLSERRAAGSEAWRLAAVLGCGLIAVCLTSQSPDGLERVAKDHGFEEREQKVYDSAPLPDYKLPGHEGWGSTYAAAGLGMAACAAVMFGLGAGWRPRRRPEPTDS